MRAILADELANAGPDRGVVQAHADELDVEGVRGPALPEHRLGLGEGGDGAGFTFRAELDLLADVLEDGEHQHLLRLVVVVDEALGDARLLGDVLDRAVLVALAAEHREGRLQDPGCGVGAFG